MIEKWTGRVVGVMHNEEITLDDLAKEMGVTEAYISMILHCKRNPKGIKKRIEEAIKAIKERRNP